MQQNTTTPSFNYRIRTQRSLGDLLTPAGAYLRLRDLYAQSVLMESSDYHAASTARSFIAVHPLASASIAHGVGRCVLPDGTVWERPVATTPPAAEAPAEYAGSDTAPASPADVINRLLHATRVEGDLADGAIGLYGYTSFNAVRYFEGIDIQDETRPRADAPDMLYVLYRFVIAFDHYNNLMTIHELVPEGEESQMAELEQRLHRPMAPGDYDRFAPVGDVTSPLTDDEHKANIRRGIAHCRRGDVFQIVLSRRFVQRYEGDDFKLYRALRSVNPSPYLFYFDMGGFRIFGSSPETHCRITSPDPATGQRYAYIDPIAGTARRTGNPADDARAAAYLRNDPKENAEHVMLVDLARNDLSRNCHDVTVETYKELQYYSHVIHLVSRVRGTLDAHADPVRTFIDTFPAGTLSGAPKVRAMQLISAYEPHNRGAYGGCIGVIGLDGSLNQAITIRTFVSRGGELWFQAGGGIVARSDEDYELQEVNNKLGALRRAIVTASEL